MATNDPNYQPVALTIAGFDPSGGAGVVADITTFTAFGCHATAAITSLTFQNTADVFGASHQSAATVRSQVRPVLDEFRVACCKTGMLPTAEVIEEVARLLREDDCGPLVVDPVVRSTSGYDLIDDHALAALVRELIPVARVVTPNIPEAERITGLRIENEDGMRRAASALRELGARAVVIKGGHLGLDEINGSSDPGNASALDVLDDEGTVRVFSGPWIKGASTHGTGCRFSAAVAACLGHGMSLGESVEKAKSFVAATIRASPKI